MNLIETLENLRREAYVKAVIRASESDDVAGYIGLNIPVEIFHESELMVIPVYGIDEDILKFSQEKNLCPLINATLTYAKTDKCPLIHSSKLIVVENFCPIFTEELKKLTDKQIYIYKGDIERLKLKLDEIYGKRIINASIHEEMKKISDSIKNLKHKFNLTDFQEFTIKYFINFLDLNERINFLNEISITSKFEDFNFVHEFINLIYNCKKCREFFKEEVFNG